MSRPRRCVFLCTLFLVSFTSCLFSPRPSHLMSAESLRKEEKYEEAIKEYETYIAERLKDKSAIEDYNPYFYYLLIGDCYQGLGQPEKALESYVTAKDKNVDGPIVGGKLRSLAAWYEERTRYEEAIALLQKYRDLDPLLFDLDIDRNHKAMIGAEDNSRKLY